MSLFQLNKIINRKREENKKRRNEGEKERKQEEEKYREKKKKKSYYFYLKEKEIRVARNISFLTNAPYPCRIIVLTLHLGIFITIKKKWNFHVFKVPQIFLFFLMK